MLSNILNFSGAQKLTKQQQLSISGGGINGNCQVTVEGIVWPDICEHSAKKTVDKAHDRGETASYCCGADCEITPF